MAALLLAHAHAASCSASCRWHPTSNPHAPSNCPRRHAAASPCPAGSLGHRGRCASSESPRLAARHLRWAGARDVSSDGAATPASKQNGSEGAAASAASAANGSEGAPASAAASEHSSSASRHTTAASPSASSASQQVASSEHLGASSSGHAASGAEHVPIFPSPTPTHLPPHLPYLKSAFGPAETPPWQVGLDVEKEAARRERRTVFTLKDWVRHRSSARFLHHLSTIPESGVIRGVLLHVFAFVTLAISVATYNHCYAVGTLPAGLPAPPRIAIEPIQLTSFALSLLLVFRTNASYSRFQEARRSFGSITTTARDIARQGFAWFQDMESKQNLMRWLLALANSSMTHFREGEPAFNTVMQGVLPPQEWRMLEASAHRPNFCIQMITRIIARASLPSELVLRMDENLSTLVGAISACERIINTPIPMSYTRHTARFLMVWLSCLPFSLWHYCGWAMVPISALISFVLLGIEEIGVYIEEPFSLLPLESLCEKLAKILKGMMQEHMDINQYYGGSMPFVPQSSHHPAPAPVRAPFPAAA